MISYVPITPLAPEVTGADLVDKVKQDLTDLHVPNPDNITSDNNSVTISGTTLDGTIVNYTEKFDNNHSYNWIQEYSDEDAVTKYADTIRTIIESTIFS